MAQLFCDADFSAQTVMGIDEAGRGPLAGPVVAAGVILNPQKPIPNLNDSKQLNAKTRDYLYDEIMEKALFVSVRSADVDVIDRINILAASLWAMKHIILSYPHDDLDAVLIDGPYAVAGIVKPPQVAIVKGDTLVSCIMAASIIAKVHRDRLMKSYHVEFPDYGFDSHKGYGTKFHLAAIEKLGPCPIHRKSFAPFKVLL